MALFSFLGSAAMANIAAAVAAGGSVYQSYTNKRGMRQARRDQKRDLALQMRLAEEQRAYDHPMAQAARLREAGFNPTHVSAGTYGPIVGNTRSDVNPVDNSLGSMLESFGNVYNIFRRIREDQVSDKMRFLDAELKSAHDATNAALEIRKQDLAEQKFIHSKTHGAERERVLDAQHEDMMKLKRDIAQETKEYHEFDSFEFQSKLHDIL